jgi:hypothetical protein
VAGVNKTRHFNRVHRLAHNLATAFYHEQPQDAREYRFGILRNRTILSKETPVIVVKVYIDDRQMPRCKIFDGLVE